MFGTERMKAKLVTKRERCGLGKKDTILFGLSAQLPQQTFFHVDVDGHRYETRGGSNLGKGYKVQMILGRSLLSGFQDWQVRLQKAISLQRHSRPT